MLPIVYLNGRFVDAAQATIPVTDWGFMQGVTIAEQLRTFGGKPFLTERHLRRFRRGLELIGCDDLIERHSLMRVVDEVASRNYQSSASTLKPGDDIGITIFATPGTYPTYRSTVDGESGPCVAVHGYRLPFANWAKSYDLGVGLVTTRTRQVPQDCWPMVAKFRSRMHYYLAAQEAAERNATALLLNQDETISDTPIANLVAVFENERLVTPPPNMALPGISAGFLFELASQIGLKCSHAPMTVEDLRGAGEVMLTSTPYCMLPVRSVNDLSFQVAGPVFQDLVSAWSQRVGVPIVKQAQSFQGFE